MAAPNLLALGTINVKTAILELNTIEADVIAAVATDHAIEVNSIFGANVHATVVGLLTVVIRRSSVSPAADEILCNQARVPVKQIPVNVIAAGRTIYLEEGDSLRAYANAANNVVLFVPYTDMAT